MSTDIVREGVQQSPQRAAATASETTGPSPQKSLNANAKAFQPKLDGPGEVVVGMQPANNFTKTPSPSAQGSVMQRPQTFVAPPVPPTMPPPLLNSMLFPPPGAMPRIGNHPIMPPPNFGGVPPSPMFFAPPPSPSVCVGNASLAALRSKDPPKFGCVLLVGLPSSGKTTVGRETVNGLNSDSLGWSFFSGSDHLKDGDRRPAFWESTKEVFDALSNRLDQLLEKQANPETRIKGLVIDKNCRSVEDILYVGSLLKSKGLHLVGVVGIEVKDEDTLMRRMGGGEELAEKLKYHRVTQARIVETARAAGLYRAVDGTKSKETVVQAVRTMVLGCSAQPLHMLRSLSWSAYSDSSCPVVECYKEYCSVLSTLFALIKPATGAAQWWDHKFPGFTEYTPLSTREIEDHARVALLRNSYSVRRKVDGVKHVCVFDGHALYLVPRHMRAVLRMNSEAWLGMPISNMGRLILDGDLVRLAKDRTKEKFVVYDVLFWSEASSPTSNVVRLASWKERQERLGSSICHEASAFFQKSTDCVVVHQRSEPWEKTLDLLEPLDYPSDGLIFQPHQHAQPTYMWRPPQAITCDLRLGQVLGTSPLVETPVPSTPDKMARQGSSSVFEPVQQVTKTFSLEAYDRDQKKYSKLPGESVEVRRNDVVEGCFCICGLNFDVDGEHHWTFHRARYDVSRAAYKSSVDDLVQHCLIARSRLVQWLITEKLVSQSSKDALLGTAVQPANNNITPKDAPIASRGAFGSALETAATPNAKKKELAPSSAMATNTTGTSASGSTTSNKNLEMLQRVMPAAAVKVQSTSKPRAQEDLQMLRSVLGGTSVTVVRNEASISSNPPSETRSSEPREQPQQHTNRRRVDHSDTCADCGKTKPNEDLRRDKRDDKLYCYACWAKCGTGFCADCGEFRKGHNETTRRQVGAFYCEQCWGAFQKKAAASTKASSATPSTADGAPKGQKKGPKPAATDAATAATTATSADVVPKAATEALPEGASNEPEGEGGDAAAATEKKRRRRGGRGRRKKGGSGGDGEDNDSGSDRDADADPQSRAQQGTTKPDGEAGGAAPPQVSATVEASS